MEMLQFAVAASILSLLAGAIGVSDVPQRLGAVARLLCAAMLLIALLLFVLFAINNDVIV